MMAAQEAGRQCMIAEIENKIKICSRK